MLRAICKRPSRVVCLGVDPSDIYEALAKRKKQDCPPTTSEIKVRAENKRRCGEVCKMSYGAGSSHFNFEDETF